MLQLIRKKKLFKFISVFLAFNFLAELIIPNCTFALTSGPGQPESQSFEPVGTSEMVDLFTGDFNYNIPLMEVDGYPINISYHSGIGMDHEASWVGLGWNINPGAITREMRGVPDDFNGDQIIKKFNMEPNRTYQVTTGIGGEVFGNKTVGLNAGYHIGVSYNNYTGIGFQQTLNASYSVGRPGMGSLTGGLGVTSGSDGLTLTPSLSYSTKVEKKEKSNLTLGGSVGASFNSRAGLQKLSLGASASYSYPHGVSGSYGSYGSSISFGTPSYIPQVTMPMISSSVLLSFATGLHLFGVDLTADISGSYAEQRLGQNTLVTPAYGYLNTDVGSLNSDAMLDFNREKDGAYTINTTNLPLTNSTYDIYSVAGQGISGSYRPYRSDFGRVSDTRAVNTSNSISLGVDLTSGNLVKAGVDVSVNNVLTQSGNWSSNNLAASALAFTKSTTDPLYERYYFKQAGEKSVDNDQLYASIGSSSPERIGLDDAGGTEIVAKSTLDADAAVTLSTSTNHRLARQKRNQAMTLLTRTEAATYGIQKDIYDGTNSNFTQSLAKPHHIAEITTLKSDGSRYVFGLPAYNTKQVDVVFNATGRTYSTSTGLVTYNTGDNSTSNNLGIDHYFSSTELPAYAHSYLLTAVLSPDYVDYDNIVGPSEGDLGTYTKFNYAKNTTNYNWRVPVGNTTANFNEGLKSDPNDNQGNYIYGQKEVWYLQSIETKNYVATFTTSNRNDGLGVTGGIVPGEDGALDIGSTSPLKKLDNIKLTSKKDPTTILKQVNFVYDYSLCPGVPNNISAGGKLTLTSIYFTYGTSNKARLSPYTFTYNSPTTPYNLKGYDRWGNYKPIGSIPNAENPYVDQIKSSATQAIPDQSNADANASVWSLNTITLPSGGTITVNYESDDYAYVQDRKAMQMFNIIGIDAGAGRTSATLPTGSALMGSGTSNNNFLYFKLPNSIDKTLGATAAKAIIANDYLAGITDMYFRFFVDMTNAGNFEYVTGYASIASDINNNYGVLTGLTGSTYDYGWIQLATVKTGDIGASGYTNTDVNPISRAAWQFGRLYTPQLIWDQPIFSGTTDPKSVLTAIANSSFYKNVKQFFEGANGSIMIKEYGKNTTLNKCWIRMLNPLMKKFGGGLRVKKITTSDAWNTMVSGQTEAQYGQEYTYTTTDETTGKVISSGVASYEPALGGDENPLRKPKYYGTDKAKLLVPSNEHYMEEPFGESFFPAPIVGYSKVTVVQKSPLATNVTRHATGKIVQEFYTAKDFPVITKQTTIDSRPKKQGPIGFLMQSYTVDYVTASQGYMIELNDMHGKPKAQSVYAEGQAIPISQVNYFYRTNPANPKQLANDVTAIKKDGSILTSVNCGIDFDFAVDMREQKTDNTTFGIQGNIAAMVFGLFPAIVPTAFPSSVEEYTRFRSASTTKIINRSGILEKTVAQDLGSTVQTENLAYDSETGDLLATKTINSFEDPVYSFTYPSHWAYTGMSQAAQNVGAAVTGTVTTVSNVSTSTITNASNIFVKGDEVLCTPTTGAAIKAWVYNVSGNVITLIDKAGTATVANTYTIKIVRSGRRNQQGVNVGTFSSRLNPLLDYTVPTAPVAKTNINVPAASFREVLTAGGSEFYDTHKMLSTSFTAAPDWNGRYPNTAESVDVGNMLNSLAYNGKLLINATNLYTTGPNYYYGFTPLLKSNATLSPLTSVNWYYTLSGASNSILTGTIFSSSSGGCSITLTLPTTYSWNNVVGFRNIVGLGNSTYNFNIDVVVNSAGNLIVVPIVSQTNSCFLMSVPPCSPCINNNASCTTPTQGIINPYYQGIRGNWRSLKSYLYLADRSQTAGTNNTVDVRKDGSFLTFNTSGGSIPFQPIWNTNSGNDWTKDLTYWTYTSQVTKYNPLGAEVENMDALQRYSSSLYGYNHSLPVAVANNSKYNQIAFDGFEDYNYGVTVGCNGLHFDYKISYTNPLSYPCTTQVHTGLYSMKLAAGQSIVTSRPLMSTAPATGADDTPYTIKGADDMGVFSPDTYNGNKKYVLSVWVKEDVTTPVTTYSNAGVSITAGTTPITSTIAKSDIIDGWQKQEYTFTITGGTAGNILVYLIYSGTQSAYFDDIRIHPFDGNMKSFVYNPNTLRLMAELDNNNYATFYEYDEEGALVRVKKETQNGIATIKESKSSKFKR
jgi:hypothetical protein